ncbi:MAG: hypothetical protein M0Q19_05110 [Candidatus Cloacimonetes bacterium]|nr:hypothetical protein [Candidatus Cloacimonadota bacterium]MCK9332542.1 hypothetical protein [Candidatus Cloacimonadota bacterium]
MAQKKIKVNATLELDDIQYNISIAPMAKKNAKKIQKDFEKQKEDSKPFLKIEKELSQIREDIDSLDKRYSMLEKMGENAKCLELLDKKDELVKQERTLSEQIEDGLTSTMEKHYEAEEKMYENMFNEMVSGEDAEKLKAYVSNYSFKMAVGQVLEVYEEEIKGKSI